MIEARGLGVARGGRWLIRDAGLRVARGEVLGLIGPNGSGKTTLLRCLYGALAPDAGEVRLGGADIGALPRREIARRIAVVPQERPDDSGQRLREVVALGRLPHRGLMPGLGAGGAAAAQHALERVGLGAMAERPFASLSGGEAQRGLIARALCQEAPILLLDEPTNHLDLRYQHEVLGLIRSLGLTVVIVLHDLNLAARYCDRLALLDGGQVIASGPPEAVLTPALLEPVWQVSVTTLPRRDSGLHLIFAERPLDGQNQELFHAHH
ncbi:ABC transporter ATP-binding protein [Pseudoroseicyclus aestuarii]|uniref:Iron complex transport system ATP-binding protein n=1 Tax=Pseudoroseicyclus aestuarii TaxID=1795041 RepID=A0A318SZA1_9RHOB|nr:ABC transporter ATP-binding protein [Pseudoroseicyclus aestuarii]PYE81344.1 iron complex transport system ATP-binding protein [Pseudoroseicyclus aestuarii]